MDKHLVKEFWSYIILMLFLLKNIHEQYFILIYILSLREVKQNEF